MQIQAIQKISCVALSCLIVFASGCNSLIKRDKGPLAGIDLNSAKAAGYTVDETGIQTTIPTDSKVPSVVLEVYDGKQKLERIPLPADRATYIADIVEDAQLIKKLGRINISVLRPIDATSPPLRMQVDLDSAGKRVMEGQNYSLRAGDHIQVIKEDRIFLNSILPNNAFLSRK